MAISVNAFQPMDHWQMIYSDYSLSSICGRSSRLHSFILAPLLLPLTVGGEIMAQLIPYLYAHLPLAARKGRFCCKRKINRKRKSGKRIIPRALVGVGGGEAAATLFKYLFLKS